jgi:hypothetical protein
LLPEGKVELVSVSVRSLRNFVLLCVLCGFGFLNQTGRLAERKTQSLKLTMILLEIPILKP